MTTYEMRISDWSSDVCSSDLPGYFPLELNLCPDAFQIAVNDRDRQLLTGPPVGDGAVPRRERSIDLGFIPSLGMSNIAKAEIILFRPEKRHAVEAFALAQHLASCRMSLPLDRKSVV